MSETPSFMKMVPGFEFLQGMVKNAGAAMPAMGQWVAPTLNLEELEKRINELRTVQFWLEQNARLLGTTIQALEVQRMTLSTLKTMNVSMADLRESMMLKPQAAAPSPAPSAFASAFASPPPAAAPAPEPPAAAETEAPPAGVVDPMQWWGALTKQFGELAASAIAEMPRQAAAASATAEPAPAAATKKTAAPRKAPARKAAPLAVAAPAPRPRKPRTGA
ncbi:MAG TPA: PhaM family polyhydroxyalkanoate granule multifunctional regulatory protein [Ideonella sp.]|uniref:PhaM family polyhydroxyalkanoate granule multifunctional regulatory protein n=1 Tax=Ideonella sp. TaxID=1929293 RepID=UPI002B838D45|nr:PhaM family polyhydroxyalkanoate granule multifunctional regulatory protein [Ideonella sp.]HSI46742.1 PhaM family polyhydroxyalkanoate granule multifunctional regulatory protein [Ideonella sp.]